MPFAIRAALLLENRPASAGHAAEVPLTGEVLFATTTMKEEPVKVKSGYPRPNVLPFGAYPGSGKRPYLAASAK